MIEIHKAKPENLSDGLSADETYRLHRRFDRMGRLVGDDSMKKLMNSHVMFIGLGGVGSWAAEMVLRSGVGKITLVDFDDVCVTNINRQLPADMPSVGKLKADVLAERFRKINPNAQIVVHNLFYNEETCATIFGNEFPDYVVDAIDNITAKCHLINYCRKNEIPIVVSTGSGGRMDPSYVRVDDLSKTHSDPLAFAVRKVLRSEYNFPAERDWGVMGIYSVEVPQDPYDLTYDGGKGFKCICPNKNNQHSCEKRNLIRGTAGFVTGAFAMQAASLVIRTLSGKQAVLPPGYMDS